MRVHVVDEREQKITGPYEIRLFGWTEERYFTEVPENLICELKNGEVIMHSPAKPRHQDTVIFLTVLLRIFTEERGLGKIFNGPATLRLTEGLNREPDIFFISRENKEQIGPDWIEGPAELVIEVVSEDSRNRDLVEKAKEYEDHGIREYWAVDPRQGEVRQYLRDGDVFDVKRISSGRLESIAVSGFWIEIEWLWQSPLPSAMTCLKKILGEI